MMTASFQSIEFHFRSETEVLDGVSVMDVRGVILTAHYDDMVSTKSSGSMYLLVGALKHRIHVSTSTRQPTVSMRELKAHYKSVSSF